MPKSDPNITAHLEWLGFVRRPGAGPEQLLALHQGEVFTTA